MMVYILMRRILNEWHILNVYKSKQSAGDTASFLETIGVETCIVPEIMLL